MRLARRTAGNVSPRVARAADSEASSVSGGREHDDVARGLTEVDRFAAVGDDTRLGLEKVHFGKSIPRLASERPACRAQPVSIRPTAPSSRPLRPMTTSRVRRSSPSRQSRS